MCTLFRGCSTLLWLAVLLIFTACQDQQPTSQDQGHIRGDIPPCIPVPGISVDPCELDAVVMTTVPVGAGSAGVFSVDTPRTIRDYLDGRSLTFIPHLVLRGTFLPETVRCTSSTTHRLPAYEDPGYFRNSDLIKCYADVRANSYILGAGPTNLTVLVNFLHYFEGHLASEALRTGVTLEGLIDPVLSGHVMFLEEGPGRTSNGIYGREMVLFIGPGHDRETETWEIFAAWDVQRTEDDTVIVVHPERDEWRVTRPTDYQTLQASLEMTLPSFSQAVTAAYQARVTEYGGRIAPTNIQGRAVGVDLPMLLTSANQLTQFYIDTGAYSHPDGPPSEPPPPCGLAVPDQADSPGLMRDCFALLEAEDTLRGTATLNWDTGTAIGSWDGITTGDTPSRVTRLELDDEDLTGTIPVLLGNLVELTHLDLSDNDLTGSIPRALGALANLQVVRLSGNSLTGCIPYALRSVATNDFSTLNLPYCPPAPGVLTAGTAGERSVPLTWAAVANTVKYRVEYRVGGPGAWTVDDESITGTSHTAGRLQCATAYQFRLSAFGDGTTYGAEWSDPSASVTATTETCASPVFERAKYSFEVAEDAKVGAAVGMVLAKDPDDEDTVTYTIIAGNTGTPFAVNGTTGAITVAGALNHEATDEYTLTVTATDTTDRTDTATVTVPVTDVAEAPVFDSSTVGPFDVAEDATVGATVGTVLATDPEDDDVTYAITAGNADGKFAIGSRSGAITVAEALDHETTASYTVTVTADDGDATTATPAGAVIITVTDVNEDPAFEQDPYTFEVTETARFPSVVGTVSATDPDGDDVTYAITAGNADETFAMHEETGAITVAGDLDYETTPSYTLTVQADDLKGGTATATVTIAVTDVAEDPPTAPTGLSATLADDTFTLAWTAVTGAAKYEAQVTTDAADAGTVTWTALPEVSATTTTHAPADGPACGTTYRFRVRAYGDGDTYAEVWGPESGAETVTTASCNTAPAFGASTYDFFIRDTAAAGSAVGQVAATDPDTGDTLTYAITEGNAAGKFAIDSATGQMSVAGTTAFNLASTPYYALMVETSDGNGGTAMARVRVSLTIAACHNGTVVPRPDEYTRLVRDCSVLLTAKDTLRGTASLDWSADTPIREWQGIFTGWLNRRVPLDVATIHVKDVIVSRIGLNGSVPSVLAGLVDLHRLDLDDNALTGEIPAALGQLEYLELLHLLGNRLTGSIPTELGNLSNLRILSLYANDLTGAIPAELGKLTRLEQLLLDDNDFTGELPSELANITGLQGLYVRESRLTGAIPAWLADMEALEHLFLEGNDFTGCIPAGLRDVENHDLDRVELTDCAAREEDSS